MLKRIIDFLRDLFVIGRKAEVEATVEEIVEEFTDWLKRPRLNSPQLHVSLVFVVTPA